MIAEQIVKALTISGTHTPDDIMKAIEAGEMQVWHQGDSLVTTTLSVYPRLKVCDVVLAAGNLPEIWDIHDSRIVPFARERGCGRIVGQGRMGWLKEAQKHGYDRKWIIASREIDDAP